MRYGRWSGGSVRPARPRSRSRSARFAPRSRKLLNQVKGRDDEKEFQAMIGSLDSIIKRFLAANDDSVKQTEALKDDIVQNRMLKFVNEAGNLMETAVSTAARNEQQGLERGSRCSVASSSRISMGMSVVVMIAIVSVVFSFLGIARPMTRLNHNEASHEVFIFPGRHSIIHAHAD